MRRRGQARELQRLRVRHNVPDVKMAVSSGHKTLTADLMTACVEPRGADVLEILHLQDELRRLS